MFSLRLSTALPKRLHGFGETRGRDKRGERDCSGSDGRARGTDYSPDAFARGWRTDCKSVLREEVTIGRWWPATPARVCNSARENVFMKLPPFRALHRGKERAVAGTRNCALAAVGNGSLGQEVRPRHPMRKSLPVGGGWHPFCTPTLR